jgi:hypothetical protein
VNVEERKQQARLFEQQGEFADALELYEAALAELEGTPEIWRELPLYVKAGDLSLKMGDSSGAIAHYEKAARAYAAYGSSKSVIALCTKILRVNSEHTHAFLRLVRLMIERDHLAEARLVLLEYAERMKLPKAGFVLEGMADRSDEELKPLLELLLEMGGRYEYARAQGRDESTSTETVEEKSAPEEGGTAEGESFQLEQRFESGLEPQSNEDSAEDGLVDPEPEHPFESAEEPGSEDEVVSEEMPEQASGEDTAPPTEVVPVEDDVQWVDEEAYQSMPMPRASRKVLFREGVDRKNKPKALWIGLGVAAVIVVGGLSLLLFGVISFGGDDAGGDSPVAVPEVDAADSAQIAGGNIADSIGTAGDSSPAGVNEPDVREEQDEAAAGQASALPGADDSTGVAVAEVDSAQGEAVTGDTVPTDQPAVIDDPPAAQASPDLPTGQGVMVQDFDIQSTTEFAVNGRAGFTVTQVLGTGEQLTLNAVYYGEDIDSAPGTDEMTLTPLVGDTTTAILHFNGYAVEARAVVSASVLETLLSRLVEVPPSN